MFPKSCLLMLTRVQIAEFLGVDDDVPRGWLLAQLARQLERDDDTYQRLLTTFPCELAVEPHELRELLRCSRSERRRWIREGKLPILEYRVLRKDGHKFRYPVHDRRVILKLASEQLSRWRQEYRDRRLRKEAV